MAYSVWFADSAEIGSMKADPVLSFGSKGPKIDIEIRLSEILLEIKEMVGLASVAAVCA
jgi:hypothetical protein